MWSLKTSKGYEAKKCRYRVVSYCRGLGLDLGCGDEKIVPTALGIDFASNKAELRLDLSSPNALGLFATGSLDYIFSSHTLEDLWDTEGTLKEWWRVIKAGGYLILYGPDKDYYPNIGQPGANPRHKHDLYWQDVWKIIEKFGNSKLILASRHNEEDEYSWQLVCQKLNCSLKSRNIQSISKIKHCLYPFRRKQRKCLIIRYGAIGDAIWATIILPLVKKEGYYIVYNTTPYSYEVLQNNPYIDEFILQDRNAIPSKDLGDYFREISKGFDRVINLCESVEKKLLVVENTEEWKRPQWWRHQECNKNYYNATLEAAGYPKVKGKRGELYFDSTEEYLGKIFTEYHKKYFTILWSLSGSAFHKVYPWAEYVAGEMLKRHKDIEIITVGDNLCRILEWQMPRTINKSGVWGIRQSLLMTKYVNLVIGTETGILNAAGCYDTPKICLLSHSSRENLTKYWVNDFSIESPAKCYPCHRLNYTLNACPLEKLTHAPKCMAEISPEMLADRIEQVYQKFWQPKRIVEVERRIYA